MKVREVMTKQTAFCGPETSLAGAVKIMRGAKCGFLPVVGEGGNVIGAITDRDICVALGTRDRTAAQVRVWDVVFPKRYTFPMLYTCDAEDDIHTALKTMRTRRIRRLPVVNGEGTLQGVLSLDDIAIRACPSAGRQGISCQDVIGTYKEICRPGRRSALKPVPWAA